MHTAHSSLFSAEINTVIHRFLEKIEETVDATRPGLFDQALVSQALSRDDLTRRKLQFRDLDRLLIAIRQLGMPEITLSYYRRIQLSDFGLAGYAVASSQNLQEAIDRSIRFQQLTTERFNIRQQQEGKRLVLSPILAQDHLHERIDIGEEFISGYWRMLELLLGNSVNLAQISLDLDFAKPCYWPKGNANFPCRLAFKLNRCAVSFPAEWLTLPLQTSAQEVAELCERQCEKVLQSNQSDSITARVQRALIYGLKASASLEEVAEWLHTPARTLRARIYRESTSFRKIALEVRMRLAHQYLTSTSMQVQEIAYLLGYSQTSALNTAFNKFYNLNPSEIRKLN